MQYKGRFKREINIYSFNKKNSNMHAILNIYSFFSYYYFQKIKFINILM